MSERDPIFVGDSPTKRFYSKMNQKSLICTFVQKMNKTDIYRHRSLIQETNLKKLKLGCPVLEYTYQILSGILYDR